jgi:hypothetical protein
MPLCPRHLSQGQQLEAGSWQLLAAVAFSRVLNAALLAAFPERSRKDLVVVFCLFRGTIPHHKKLFEADLKQIRGRFEAPKAENAK